jgi:hypothetical protein
MQASAIWKNTSLIVCVGCVAIITVVVLTLPPGFRDGTSAVLLLSSPLLIPVVFSFWMHTRVAHWYNAGPALFYVGVIVLIRLAFVASLAATMIISHLFVMSLPITGIGMIASWASAWNFRNPRDLRRR